MNCLRVIAVTLLVAHNSVGVAGLATGWDVGSTAPDFTATNLDSGGAPQSVSWYDELGADVYVISTCAMWCGPCQQFALGSGQLVQTLAQEGVNVKVYDFIFENVLMSEPGQTDAQAWIDNVWSSVAQNVWYGGDISTQSASNVTFDIFSAVVAARGGDLSSGVGLPSIVVLDSNFVVTDLLEGYVASDVEQAVRSAAVSAVPEFGPAPAMAVGVLGWLMRVGRRR